MAKPEELFQKWKKKCPSEVDLVDFEKVIRRYLGPWLREKKGTSHIFIVEHKALAYHPAFRGYDTLSISIVSGRRIKGIWVDHTLKAIECIEIWEHVAREKENRK